MARYKARKEEVKPAMIYFDLELWERGRMLASHLGVPFTDFVNKLLRDKVDQNQEQLKVLESLEVK